MAVPFLRGCGMAGAAGCAAAWGYRSVPECRRDERPGTADHYDFIVVGSGPGAAGWLDATLSATPHARILLLERGPDCQTDILTERNPLTLLRDSARVVAEYAAPFALPSPGHGHH